MSLEMIVKQQISDDGAGEKKNEFYGKTGKKTA